MQWNLAVLVVVFFAFLGWMAWLNRERTSIDSATEIIKASVGPMWTSYQVPIGASRWVPVTKRLPRFDRPVPVWGDDMLDDDEDEPKGAVGMIDLAGKGIVWVSAAGQNTEEELRRLVGNVTHWLDWSPPAGTEG